MDSELDLRVAFAQEWTRRRVLASFGLAGAAAALAPRVADAAQEAATATPSADQEQLDGLAALSKELCGGGDFAPAMTATLRGLLTADAKLANGLDELLAAAPGSLATATPAALSADGKAASEAILLFWYTGSFNGDPITDRAADYTQLLAWQAMYTPAWTTCKLFGAWADPPTLTPQVPENA